MTPCASCRRISPARTCPAGCRGAGPGRAPAGDVLLRRSFANSARSARRRPGPLDAGGNADRRRAHETFGVSARGGGGGGGGGGGDPVHTVVLHSRAVDHGHGRRLLARHRGLAHDGSGSLRALPVQHPRLERRYQPPLIRLAELDVACRFPRARPHLPRLARPRGRRACSSSSATARGYRTPLLVLPYRLRALLRRLVHVVTAHAGNQGRNASLHVSFVFVGRRAAPQWRRSAPSVAFPGHGRRSSAKTSCARGFGEPADAAREAPHRSVLAH